MRPQKVFTPSVMPSSSSKDGADDFGTVPSILEKSRTVYCPRLSDQRVDITV